MERLGLIVAIGRGGLIGSREAKLGLPWHIPEDLKHFKRVTSGHAIIMGRTTFEAIGRPLPKRLNIVLTRSQSAIEGVEIASSVDEAIEIARASGDELPFIIGGASVYAQSLDRVTDFYITEVDRDAEGDAFFPSLESQDLVEVERRQAETPDVVFVHLQRR